MKRLWHTVWPSLFAVGIVVVAILWPVGILIALVVFIVGPMGSGLAVVAADAISERWCNYTPKK